MFAFVVVAVAMACDKGDKNAVGFQSIQLFKDQLLGIGSYGAVCKAKCDNLPCAAKLLHPILFDPMARALVSRQTEHRLPIRRFEQECQFLSSIKHPNIVQYLGTHQDPESRMPVLLMELLDESLTSFLERSRRKVPFHIQVTISNDIAQALSFLHSNGIIHRDLSSNNVLMIGNSRTKVTDFGMATLAGVHPLGSLTQTPGADVYMPPEATKIPPVYSEKIDCFSHGVLGVQIITRLFPKPGDRLKEVRISDPNFPSGSVRVAVSEIERRQEHIDLIDRTHPLLAVAVDCLKDDEGERPSAQEICGRLAAVKQDSQFTESVQEESGKIQQLQQKLAAKEDEIHAKETEKKRIMASKDRDIAILSGAFTEQQRENQQLRQVRLREKQEQDQLLAEKVEVIISREREITTKEQCITEYQQKIQHLQASAQVKDHLLEAKDSEMQKLRQQVKDNKKMLEEIQQASLIKTRRLSGLKEQLPLHAQASSGMTEGLVNLKLKWRKHTKVMHAVDRSSDAVVQGSVAYFRIHQQIHGFDSTIDDWFQLPDCPRGFLSLAVVDNLLTAIGGWKSGEPTNSLFSLTEERSDKKWVQKFPPMPTKRSHTCAVSSVTALIVIGGMGSIGRSLSVVEVMDISSKVWTIAASLPEPLHSASATICGDRIYVLGALTSIYTSTKSVFTCSLSALLQSCQPTSATRSLQTASLAASTSVWSKVADLPVRRSTCVTLQGRLLSIGGKDSGNNPTTAVRIYDPATNSWSVSSHMTTPRRTCFAAVLPGNDVIAVGGLSCGTVDIANLL